MQSTMGAIRQLFIEPDDGVSTIPGVSPATRLALILTLRLDGPRTVSPDRPSSQTQPQPLDASELTRLARWLQERDRDALALPNHPEDLLDGWSDRTMPVERIVALIARQDAIDRAVLQWTSQGIWILRRKDRSYPRARLTARLGDAIPPVLFGVGAHHLLDSGGTGIVGSRDTQVATLTLAQELGAAEARGGRTVISGGARGVDERAVQGAFLGGGSAIVLLGDSLTRQATKVVHAEHLAAGTLTLVSPYAPDAPFSTANAMGRNRLIYCLADDTIVVASSEGKGGSFVGAREALRRGWGPVWVAPSDDQRSGNPLLLHMGALPLAERPAPPPRQREDAPALPTVGAGNTPPEEIPGETLYRSFIVCWQSLPETSTTIPELAAALDLTPEQTRMWVFQAVERRDATRLTSPVRYAVHPRSDASPSP
ncbi:MAG: DNA-processing protein DprA [Thermomicrobiales bacterium]